MKFSQKVASFSVAFMLLGQAYVANAQHTFVAAAGSTKAGQVNGVIDNNPSTGWPLDKSDLKKEQSLQLTLASPGDVDGLSFLVSHINEKKLKDLLSIYITYDPANPGNPIPFTVKKEGDQLVVNFKSTYGAHIKLGFKSGVVTGPIQINELYVHYSDAKVAEFDGDLKNAKWMNPTLSIAERVKSLLAVMKPEEKISLLREGWGIPGMPKYGIPAVNKVEDVHGFSYGSGATVFPQAIGMGATWDKALIKEVGETIGDETVSAHTLQAWSPVLDVAQDPRWGRMEETYGEDPILVSMIGGAWITGIKSKGIMVTPKHFAAHGAPLGGRDSHDIGLSERELREVHLVPFRDAFEKYKADATMVNYSSVLGVPSDKSKWLMMDVLRDEWGFTGFVVSDCGGINNMTAKKHYVAKDKIEAANEALAVGVAVNCGDTYNDKTVIEAAKEGKINMENLNFTASTLLSTMFKKGYFETTPAKSLDWNTVYPGWRSPEHLALARKTAAKSIVLLKNEKETLPLKQGTKTIAVLGPGADNLQPGDYSPKTKEGQLVSVLTGIKEHVGANAKVLYNRGCTFVGSDSLDIEGAVKAAKQSDIAVLVLGDCSTSESTQGIIKTSGEANDYASLILPGEQQKLLEAVCAAGKPVVLVLQAGRPYNLKYAAANCAAILVNWLPGEQGGYATADVLFGDYNPAGRLPVTFPQSVAQLPLYYNFKPSGRKYNYVDMKYYPLYPFGFGLSYTSFEYSDLETKIQQDGSVAVSAKVRNTGTLAGDEVVELYITDMYASIDTRVMELKNFDRIHLNPGETKKVDFVLSPYDLSLLNVDMDRVVEPGDFKIMVGGSSPAYIADDQIKNSVGFKSSTQGLNATIDYKEAYGADFELSKGGFDRDSISGKKLYYINIKNNGNLTDADRVNMYVDGKFVEEHHFEIEPGKEKKVYFKFDYNGASKVIFTTRHASLIL